MQSGIYFRLERFEFVNQIGKALKRATGNEMVFKVFKRLFDLAFAPGMSWE